MSSPLSLLDVLADFADPPTPPWHPLPPVRYSWLGRRGHARRTLRGSRDGEVPGQHLDAAYAVQAAAVLAQVRVDAKTTASTKP